MEQNDPPVYIVAPGRVFRSDQLDATHSPVFHQLEGLAIDKNLSFTDLKGTLEYFTKEFFGENIETKFIPHFFPFTPTVAMIPIIKAIPIPYHVPISCISWPEYSDSKMQRVSLGNICK